MTSKLPAMTAQREPQPGEKWTNAGWGEWTFVEKRRNSDSDYLAYSTDPFVYVWLTREGNEFTTPWLYFTHVDDWAEQQVPCSKRLDTAKQRIATALEFARYYGTTDGSHHKMWVIDHMVRALTGYTYEGAGDSPEYLRFVADHNAGEDGPDTYQWDTGVAP